MPKVARPLPNSDWNLRELMDAKIILPGEVAKCEFCNQTIRWVHVLQHEDYHRPMGAGCCCANRLCNDYDAVDAERRAKNYSQRLARFIAAKQWKTSVNNPPNVWRWVKVGERKRERLTLYLKEGTWGVYLDGAFHFERYGSKAEAMAMAFEIVERMSKR